MIRPLDTVALTHDIEASGLRAEDVGAVVHRYVEGTYEVEFVTGAGETVAIRMLSGSDVRPLARTDMLHVRSLSRA